MLKNNGYLENFENLIVGIKYYDIQLEFSLFSLAYKKIELN